METKALVEVVKGKPRVLLQTAEGTYITVDAYMKYLKEKEKKQQKAVEEVKKIGKKEKIKAFLKKVVEKKRKVKKIVSKELFKQELLETSAVLKGVKKIREGWWDRGYDRYAYFKNDFGLEIQRATREDKITADGYMSDFQKGLEAWFYDEYFIDEELRTGSDALDDFIKLLKAIMKAGKNYIEGKDKTVVLYQESDIQPPYSSDLGYDTLNRLLANFEGAKYDIEQEVEYANPSEEEYDDDDEPYNIEFTLQFYK